MNSRKTAAHLGLDKATIKRIIIKVEDLGPISIPERKKGSLRIRKMTNGMLGMIKRQILKCPTMTAFDLKQTVAELAPVNGP
jgi:hypothetical protein